VITSGRIRRGHLQPAWGEKANSYRNLMGKSEEKGKRGRPIHTRGENTKMNLNKGTG